jgi:hypothetical protein
VAKVAVEREARQADERFVRFNNKLKMLHLRGLRSRTGAKHSSSPPLAIHDFYSIRLLLEPKFTSAI